LSYNQENPVFVGILFEPTLKTLDDPLVIFHKTFKPFCFQTQQDNRMCVINAGPLEA
jgi:hypothetical protein